MRLGAILLSHARAVTPRTQRCRERGLLAAAALGESHLHVSTLEGEGLSLGTFHRPLPGEGREPAVWRRHTGGRVLACGRGSLVATLGLPHRAALVADERGALKPEQVMNRCVRGLLAALRRLGIDPIYPGLDLVTSRRRTLAHLSFVEDDDGTTLFQAILAVHESFARAQALIDRLDPTGAAPVRLLEADEATTLVDEIPARAASLLEPAEFLSLLAEGYRETFALEVTELDPEVTDVLASGYEDEPDPVRLPAPPDPERCAYTVGRLGPIEGWIRARDDTIEAAGIAGAFVAPDGLVERLDEKLRGRGVTRDSIRDGVEAVVDGSNGYVLGLTREALVDLLVSAAGVES